MKIENVTKKYENKVVLDSLTLDIGEGIYVLTGASGCGKTTLLRLIAGLESADGGIVEAGGSVAMAFQDDRLFPWMSVLENACVASSPEKAKAVLDSLGMGAEYSSMPESLSGGMKKRVSLAGAFSADRDILLLDEPFNGLDDRNISLVLKAITECRAKTVIISSHDLDAVEGVATGIIDLTK